jgi:glycosyltransferase involved in cell wall biosynthesis
VTHHGPRAGKPLRILHVDHARVLGGAARSILELAVAQRERGDDVTVAVGRAGEFSAALSAAGVPWISMDWPIRAVETSLRTGPVGLAAGFLSLVRAARSVQRVMRATTPDLVVAHSRKSQIAASIGMALSRAPLVWHLHDPVPPRAVVRVPFRILGLRANLAVALTQWQRDEFAEAHIPPRGTPVVVGNGVDIRPLEVLAPAWPIRRGVPVVGFIGSVSAWKAPHLVVDAAALVPAEMATFRLFGSLQFPETEAAYGASFERLLAASPARDRIAWRGQTATAADAFREIDILVHCSTTPEPFGRVLVEAMASGRGIIAFRFGSPTELLDDTCATFATTPDAEGIAGAIRALVGDPHMTQERIDHARLRASAHRPAVLAARLDSLCRDLL